MAHILHACKKLGHGKFHFVLHIFRIPQHVVCQHGSVILGIEGEAPPTQLSTFINYITNHSLIMVWRHGSLKPLFIDADMRWSQIPISYQAKKNIFAHSWCVWIPWCIPVHTKDCIGALGNKLENRLRKLMMIHVAAGVRTVPFSITQRSTGLHEVIISQLSIAELGLQQADQPGVTPRSNGMWRGRWTSWSKHAIYNHWNLELSSNNLTIIWHPSKVTTS